MIRFGFDLGANHIRLISKEDGLVFDEPCMVALDRKNRVIAIGNEAKDMKGMDESIRVISPLGQKEIDFDALNLLMEQLCYQFNVFRVFQKTELIVSFLHKRNVNIVLQINEISVKLVGLVWFLLSLQRCMNENREAIKVKYVIIA